MKHMKRILFIIIVTVLCVACATTNRKQNDRKKLEKSELISKAICNRDFKINVQTAHPTRGMSVTLTADFNIRVKGDSVVSYLPYFGRAYNVPYGGGKALNFSGVTQDYKITQPKRDKMHMEFSVKTKKTCINSISMCSTTAKRQSMSCLSNAKEYHSTARLSFTNDTTPANRCQSC